MENFATVEDVQTLWRTLKFDEKERAEALLEVVSHSLRVEAKKVGKDLDGLVATDPSFAMVVKSVTVDVVVSHLDDLN